MRHFKMCWLQIWKWKTIKKEKQLPEWLREINDKIFMHHSQSHNLHNIHAFCIVEKNNRDISWMF